MANGDLIGVVTVTYNSADVLPDFLRCMAAQTHREYILFVVDNASKDHTARILRECTDERLRIVANPDNRGVAAGNNQGIRAALEAGCRSVMLMNNDTEFEPTLIAQLDEGLDRYRVEMVCPKMMCYDEPERIWAAGGELQPWLGYRSRHFGFLAHDDGTYDTPIKISYAPTCCVLMDRSVIEKIGLMDPFYFVYVDDVDFMYRAYKAALKLMYLPHICLLHKVGSSTGGANSPVSVRFYTRNRVYYLLKHFGVIRSSPWLVLEQVYFWYRFFLRGERWTDLILREKSFYEGFGVFKEYRRKLQREKGIEDTRRISDELTGGNKQAVPTLQEQGPVTCHTASQTNVAFGRTPKGVVHVSGKRQ